MPLTILLLLLTICGSWLEAAPVIDVLGCDTNVGWRSPTTGTFCYLLVNDTLPFFEARDYCHNLTAELVSIADEAELGYLHQLIIDSDVRETMWAGRYRCNGEWLWLDGLEGDGPASMWAGDEPRDDGFMATLKQGHLTSQSSSSLSLPFICKKKDMGPIARPPCETPVSTDSCACYWATAVPLSHSAAQTECLDNGGVMANLSSAGMSEFLRRFLIVFEPSLLRVQWNAQLVNYSVNSQVPDQGLCLAITFDLLDSSGLFAGGIDCNSSFTGLCRSVNPGSLLEAAPVIDDLDCNRTIGWRSPTTGTFCYLLVNDSLPFFEARDYCHNLTAELVSIADKAELDYLQQLINDSDVRENLWAGRYRCNGEWLWLDGLEGDGPASMWSGNDAQNDGSLTAFHQGHLTSQNSTSPSFPFICKKEKGGSIARPPCETPVSTNSCTCYWATASNLTHSAAQVECVDSGGVLAHLFLAANTDFLIRFLTALQENLFWVALDDQLAAETMNLTEDQASGLEVCMAINFSNFTFGGTLDCNSTYAGICQRVVLSQDSEPACDLTGINTTTRIVTALSTNALGIATVRVDCVLGHTFVNTTLVPGANITCRNNGTWSEPLPVCQPVDCGVPTVLHAVPVYTNTSYNSTAILQCDTGHWLPDHSTSKDVQCGVDGTWQPRITCNKIDCGPPPFGRNVRFVAHLYTTYGSEATVKCKLGFGFPDGSISKPINCTEGGVWSSAGECEAVSCGDPDPPANANLSYTSTMYASEATVICDVGYELTVWTTQQDNVDVITCGANGTWTPFLVSCETPGVGATGVPPRSSSLPDPAQVSGMIMTTVSTTKNTIWPPQRKGERILWCSPPTSVQNSIVEWEHTFIGDTATYICHHGYRFSDGSVMRVAVCMEDGRWSHTPTSCQQLRCPPVEVINAVVDSDHREVDSVVTLTCEDGKLFSSGRDVLVIKCVLEPEGQFDYRTIWTGLPEECQERCEVLPYLDTGDVISFTNELGQDAGVRCRPGHRFHDLESIKPKAIACSREAFWIIPEYCIVDVCPYLSSPANGSLTQHLPVYGTVAQVHCHEGYRFPDFTNTTYLLCQEYGIWNDTFSDCLQITCPPPPTVKFSSREIEGSHYSENVTYTCDGDLRMPDGYHNKTIICRSDEHWSEDDLSCAANRCPPVPAVPHTVANTSLALSGTVAGYSCVVGYTLTNGSSTSVYCDGVKWLGPEPTCRDTHCPELDASGLHAATNTTETKYGALVDLECQHGYTLPFDNDSMTTVCQANETWDPTPMPCQLRTCNVAELPIVRHAIRNLTEDNLLSNPGTEVLYTCIEGHVFKREVFEQRMRCFEDGTWQPGDLSSTCVPATCPVLPFWEGLVLNTSNRASKAVVRISCDKGGSFADNEEFKTTRCGSRGSWKPAVPECKFPAKEAFVPVPTEAKDGQYYAVLAVTLIVFQFLVVLWLDIMSLLHTFGLIKTDMRVDIVRLRYRK